LKIRLHVFFSQFFLWGSLDLKSQDIGLAG
jgi:hypothetical protein